LQQLIGQGRVSSAITEAAQEGAGALGLRDADIVEAVLALTPDHFYKTMEAERFPGLWQDVYHLEFRGLWLYIKLQHSPGGLAVVVQCKRR
jgi:motility quorum-sensing regulator/GCU-specific mRNA interferase toxin